MHPSTLVILNPTSGRGTDPAEFSATVRESLPCRVALTQEEGDAARLAAEGVAAGATRIVAAGGDGTVRGVVEGMVRAGSDAASTPELGLIPLGTGNDLARTVGIPLQLKRAVALLAASSATRPLDLLRVTRDGRESWAANAVVVGNGARLGTVLDSDDKTFWGPLSYLRSAVEVVVDLQPVSVLWQLDDGEARAFEVLNVVAANGAGAGRGVPIAPGADPFDGQLDAVMIENAPSGQIVQIGTALLAGGDADAAAYHRRAARRVRMESRQGPLPVSIDGEPVEAEVLAVELVAGRLRLVVEPDEGGTSFFAGRTSTDDSSS